MGTRVTQPRTLRLTTMPLRRPAWAEGGRGRCSRSQAKWLLAKRFLKMDNINKCLMRLLPMQLRQSAVHSVKILRWALFCLIVPTERFNPVSRYTAMVSITFPTASSKASDLVDFELIKFIAVALTGSYFKG